MSRRLSMTKGEWFVDPAIQKCYRVRPMNSRNPIPKESDTSTFNGRRKTPLTKPTARQERLLSMCRKVEHDRAMEAEKHP